MSPTPKLRILNKKNGLSMNPNYLRILQQWWEADDQHGEWRDVPIVNDESGELK